MAGIIGSTNREDSLAAVAQVLLAEGHPEHALAVLSEARELSPEDAQIRLGMADALIRLDDLDGARVALDEIGHGSGSRHLALAKTVLVELLTGDEAGARRAIDELRPVAGGLYAGAYEAALIASAPDAPPPDPPDGIDRQGALDVVLELAATLLEIGRLTLFNRMLPLLYALAPEPSDVFPVVPLAARSSSQAIRRLRSSRDIRVATLSGSARMSSTVRRGFKEL